MALNTINVTHLNRIFFFYIFESGVKHHKPNQSNLQQKNKEEDQSCKRMIMIVAVYDTDKFLIYIKARIQSYKLCVHSECSQLILIHTNVVLEKLFDVSGLLFGTCNSLFLVQKEK